MSEPKRAYLYGYSGRRPAALLDACLRLDAVLLDCRYSPRSRVPAWSGTNLQRLLGDRYVWCKPWGNHLYKSDEAALADPAGGLAIFDSLDRPTAIVMCVCAATEHCHRRLIRDLLLRERGIVATELDVKDELEARQLTIFSEGER